MDTWVFQLEGTTKERRSDLSKGSLKVDVAYICDDRT